MTPTHPAVAAVADRLGIDGRLLRAVLLGECGHDIPPPDGTRPTIRVEAHHVLREVAAGRGLRAAGESGVRVRWWRTGSVWDGRGPEPAGSWADVPWDAVHDQVRHEVEVDGAWLAYHGDQDREWNALDCADNAVGGEVATACTSWGMAQILGVAALGPWQSTRALAAVDGGLGLFEEYVTRVLPDASDALRRGDLEGFARIFNGTGQIVAYAGRIRQHGAALGLAL